jgi:hypothetical protein
MDVPVLPSRLFCVTVKVCPAIETVPVLVPTTSNDARRSTRPLPVP